MASLFQVRGQAKAVEQVLHKHPTPPLTPLIMMRTVWVTIWKRQLGFAKPGKSREIILRYMVWSPRVGGQGHVPLGVRYTWVYRGSICPALDAARLNRLYVTSVFYVAWCDIT